MSKHYDELNNIVKRLEAFVDEFDKDDESPLKKISNSVDKALGVSENAKWVVDWTVTKFADKASHLANKPFATEHIKQNIVVDGGATAVLNLMCGKSGTQPFDAANAHIAVGASSTAENAGQSALLAGTSQQAFKGMDSGYPQVSGRTVLFKATFDEDEANFDWAELGVFNGGAGSTMLNRRVKDLGRKATGIWSIQVQISLTSNP